MDQPTFADLEYQGKKRKTRREVFLERMDGLIPWQLLEDRICPFYPKAGRGRHLYRGRQAAVQPAGDNGQRAERIGLGRKSGRAASTAGQGRPPPPERNGHRPGRPGRPGPPSPSPWYRWRRSASGKQPSRWTRTPGRWCRPPIEPGALAKGVTVPLTAIPGETQPGVTTQACPRQ